MQLLDLKEDDWKKTLDHISRAPQTQKVRLETVRHDVEAQTLRESVEFGGISFDPGNVVLFIRAGAVQYVIHQPLKIGLTYRASDIIGVEVTCEDGARYLVTFLPPLHLPDLLVSFFPIKS